jgi:hypothetical protein
MMNDLSEMAALFTFFGLGVAYIWLSVVINRRQRAQRLVLEQLKETSTGARSINSRRRRLDRTLGSEVAQRLAGQ